MCGRFTISFTYNELLHFAKQSFHIDDFDLGCSIPRYNVAPNQDVIALIYDGKQYRIGPLYWGYLPPYAKTFNSKYKTINTREETIEEKNAFQSSYHHRRCVILADGYYEWKQENNEKQPFYITMKKQQIFGFAGIWRPFQRGSETIYTTSIITTKANNDIKDIHHRMPVILTKDNIKDWLQPERNTDESLHSYLTESNIALTSYKVSKKVNNASYESKDTIQPL